MRKKYNKIKNNPPQGTNWQELLERKDDFLRIIEVLNRYYSLNPPDNYPSESHKFRDKLLKTPAENFKVFLKQFGDFEYFIAVELETKEGTRFDSWIHIDG
ncbi:MAG: hypothetical protein IT569_00330, partial [Leptospiraceae bacterium]|nr:hypothetical protein [Leptospiraceae bacterium]